MADLTEIQAAGTTKVVGSDLAGVETFPMGVDSSGNAKVTNPSEGTSNSTAPTVSILVGGSDGTNLRPLATDNQGRLVTSAITGFGANFTFGDVIVAATTLAAVRRTPYTEQTTNAQRSVVSSSALDTAAGTGARMVKITYYDVTGAGPSTETITLNGIVAVNTVSTTICYVEKIEVVTAGVTGSNAGVLSLKAAIAGAGVTVGTIAIGDNQTFWCHHYIPTGKICNITGFSVNHNGTTVGSGGLFFIKSFPIAVPNGVEKQVGDFHRLYGQQSTTTRNYGSPIVVAGPARILGYVTPETASSTAYRASMDFFEP